MAQALEIAQRALDLEAAQGRKLLSFPRVDEQHIVWGRNSETVPTPFCVWLSHRPYLFSVTSSAGASVRDHPGCVADLEPRVALLSTLSWLRRESGLGW
jgi:hypothetical protein